MLKRVPGKREQCKTNKSNNCSQSWSAAAEEGQTDESRSDCPWDATTNGCYDIGTISDKARTKVNLRLLCGNKINALLVANDKSIFKGE